MIQFSVLLAGGLAVAGILDNWCGHEFPIVFALAVGGSFISYIYSAPPLKLKQNGWIGNYALARAQPPPRLEPPLPRGCAAAATLSVGAPPGLCLFVLRPVCW